MIKPLLIFSFLCSAMAAYGQTQRLDKDTSNYKNSAIILLKINGQQTLQASSFIIDNNDIDSVKIEPGADYVKNYGPRANNGVLIIYIAPGTLLVNTPQLLARYEISPKDRLLPVFIDSAIAYKPKNIYFQPSTIQTVQIQRENKTGIRYISIRTVYPINGSKSGTSVQGAATKPETGN